MSAEAALERSTAADRPRPQGRRAGRALPPARRAHPARGDPHPRRRGRPARRRRAATRVPGCRTTRAHGCVFLRDTIIDVEAVRHADDVWFDDYGNLVWMVRDPFDGIAPEHQRVIYFDGHSDTVQALRDQWHDKLGGAVDPYDGLVDRRRARPRRAARASSGYVPPEDEWEHLVFGRGVGRPARRRGRPDRRHQDPARAASTTARCTAASSAPTPPRPRRTTTAAGRAT